MRAEASVRTRGMQIPALCLLLIFSLIAVAQPVSSQSNEDNFPTGPGLDWQMPEEHRLFVNGTQSADNLDRNFPYFTGEPPFETFEFGSTTVIDVESAPAEETVTLSGEASVYVYASLITDNDACRATQFFDGLSGKTSFTVWLDVGTTSVIDGEQSDWMPMENGWEGAHEFFVNATYNNVTLGEGDVITLIVQANHNCLVQGRVYWDAYHTPTGAILGGEMLQPELQAQVDSNGLVRIEFIPISAWGAGDYGDMFVDLVGPLEGWDEGRHLTTRPSEDQHIEHFEVPHGTRVVEANRTALIWMSNETLGPGMYMIDACFMVNAGDYNEDCDSLESDHVIGVYRFEVEERPQPLAGSGWFWLISIASLLGYTGLRLRSGYAEPLTWGLLLMLTLAAMAPASALPELDVGASRVEAAAPNFSLLQHPSHGSGTLSLNELLDGKDALVLGVITVGSPNAELQKRDFENASSRLGEDVAFAQLVTGDEVRVVDIDFYANFLNGSWPLLMDEAGGDVAHQLPSGIADGVIIIDSAGYISSWSPGSLSDQQIVQAVDRSMSGSSQSVFGLFALLLPSLMLAPLILMAFPLRRTGVPKESLAPGAGLGGTVVAGAIGFGVWAIPVAILSPFLASFWPFIEMFLMFWLAWQGLSLAIHGKVHEIDWISSQIHKRLPEAYRNWRHEVEFGRDVLLGHWIAWISWFAMPLLIPQGIGAAATASIVGLLIAPFNLLLHLIVAGLLVLLLRVIAAAGGPFSRMAGNFGHEEVPRLWGCLLIGMAVWWILWLVLGPIGNTLFS